MLGLKQIRNPYLATLAIALLVLPLLWIPSHFHRGAAHRAHCAICLLATMSLSVLAAGVVAVTLALSRHAITEIPALAQALAKPRFHGRAPPTPAGL